VLRIAPDCGRMTGYATLTRGLRTAVVARDALGPTAFCAPVPMTPQKRILHNFFASATHGWFSKRAAPAGTMVVTLAPAP
jgi:hypothetical protein